MYVYQFFKANYIDKNKKKYVKKNIKSYDYPSNLSLDHRNPTLTLNFGPKDIISIDKESANEQRAKRIGSNFNLIR